MNINCIPKSDDVFAKFIEISTENKRYLLGKYAEGITYKTDLTKSTPIYNGEKICHRKFNFTTEGAKCFWCNTIALLTSEGEIMDSEPITIKYGQYKDQNIIIKQYPKSTVPFGTYEPDTIKLKSNILTVEETLSRQRMINKSDDASHDIAISCLINSSQYPFKSNTLSGWICDKINLVKLLPKPGNVSTVSFNDRMMKNTFFQIFVMSAIRGFSHGSPSSKHLFISNFPSSYPIGGGKVINMNTTLFLDTDIYSSFEVNYNDRKLYFVGKHSVSEMNEPKLGIEILIGHGKSKGTQVTKSPVMTKYNTERILTITPSMEIVNYNRFTGINIFPQFYFFIYLTILLLNKSFYDEFNKSKLVNMVKGIFIKDDYEKYMRAINLHMGTTPDADGIIKILIDSGISIRYDSLDLLKNEISSIFE